MHRSRGMIPILAVLAAAAVFVAPTRAAQGQGTTFESPVVSTQWLADHLNDPNVVVLHLAFSRREYTAGHIPGSRFLWFNDVAPGTPDLSTELPSVAKLDSLFESLGVSDSSRIVVYGGTVTPLVARVFVTLDYLGAGDRAAVLDGGFNAWKAEGRTVSTEAPKVARGKFTPRVRSDAVVDANFVKANINTSGVSILDARTPNFYSGEGGGGPRPGHVESAKNLPFITLSDSTGKLKDRAILAGMFSSAGVQPSDRVVTYCHVGQQASLLFLAARHAGFKASLYDGSFEDWSSRDDTPVVGPVKK
ncbi:MAG: Thiosulfate sulfurtransferase [Geminicoccaceae bacterium]|nr:Thiosulfate sulfurtransferase [Geminicoccaceae bacterium]